MLVSGTIPASRIRQYLKTAMLSQAHFRYQHDGKIYEVQRGITGKSQHYLDNFEEYDEVIPSAVGLALVLNIRRSTLYEWAKSLDKKAFTDILDWLNGEERPFLEV